MLKTVHRDIRKASNKIGLSTNQIEELLELDAAHEVELMLDSGKKVNAYRMQHNNSRGPYKGGIRFHPEVNFDEVKALATLMSLKTALLGLPLGGGKGGVQINPKNMSIEELEEVSRKYVQALQDKIGPDKDIPAPDVNTNPQIMDWMADEYTKLTGDETKGSFTGKTLENKGSLGRNSATGQGGLFVLEKLLELQGKSIKNISYAIQGFGNAGAMFAGLVSEKYPSWKLVAVTDSSGGLYSENGLSANVLAKHKKDKRKFVDFEEEKHITEEEFLKLDVDVMVFAALGDFITEDNVGMLQAKYVLELANGPINSKAADELAHKGIVQIPDFLANAGGVVVSYFEWVQNLKNEQWDEQKVMNKLREYMQKATVAVYDLSQKEGVSLKEAAFLLSVKRLIEGDD